MSPTVMLISMEWFKACTRATCFGAAVDKLLGGEGVEIDVWMEKQQHLQHFLLFTITIEESGTNIASKMQFVSSIAFWMPPSL